MSALLIMCWTAGIRRSDSNSIEDFGPGEVGRGSGVLLGSQRRYVNRVQKQLLRAERERLAVVESLSDFARHWLSFRGNFATGQFVNTGLNS